MMNINCILNGLLERRFSRQSFAMSNSRSGGKALRQALRLLALSSCKADPVYFIEHTCVFVNNRKPEHIRLSEQSKQLLRERAKLDKIVQQYIQRL